MDADPVPGSSGAPAEPPPVWDAAAAQSATDTAFGAMQAFVHTNPDGSPLDATEWFAGLAAYLSLTAQRAYYGTDPALVPAHRVTGVVARADSTPYLALVDAGTDVGTYSLLLSRTGAESGWSVERIEPPAGVK